MTNLFLEEKSKADELFKLRE